MEGPSESSTTGRAPSPTVGTGAVTTVATTATTTADTSGGPGSSGGATSTGVGAGTETSESSSGSVLDGTTGATTGGANELGEDCDVYAQDCARGLKCTYDEFNGGSWIARCVSIPQDPAELGEPCETIENADNCALGAWCSAGQCEPLCFGSEEEPLCEDGFECTLLDSTLGLCVESCDPTSEAAAPPNPACPAGKRCAPRDGAFFCLPDESGEDGAQNDACPLYLATQCDPGLVCVSALDLAGCDTESCCTPFCDVELYESLPPQQQNCPPEYTCAPWYEPGEAPAGLEHVGFCHA